MNSVKTIKMNVKGEFLNEIRNKSKALCSIVSLGYVKVLIRDINGVLIKKESFNY